MLKLVGTEAGEVLDEKVILDDNDKLTSFGWKLVVLDIVLDICLFTLFRKLFKSKK